ncbi:MAG: SDR family NAD(P)-dependent oxidoreductase [Desulfobacterales bacterium]|nr:SDR family NAD(P)-dependent oxidoreductase [Desulfobacterales bacterium]
MQRNSKSVLITGCSSGIGQYLMRALQKDGWQVIPTDKTATENMLQLDLMSSDSIKSAVREVEDMTKGKLYALINNAGILFAGKLENIARTDMRKQFEVNVFGVHELIRQVIPIFKRNSQGRIINISSITGKVSFPNMGAYSASKFALEALTDAFRLELKGTGIKVSLIEPGSIESNLRENAICRDFELKRKKGRNPEIVYRKIKHALESRNPKIRYLAGDEWIVYLRRILPDIIFDKVMKYV